MKRKKEIESKNVDRINKVLKNVPNYIQPQGKHLIPVHEFYYCVHEMCLINRNWSPKLLETCLMELWDFTTPTTYELVDQKYDELIKEQNLTKRNELISFYVPTNLPIQEGIRLLSFDIKIVAEIEKERILEIPLIKNLHCFSDFSFLKTEHLYLLEFSTRGLSIESVKDDFYSTYHLLKGIGELTFDYFHWEDLSNNSKKQSSHFKYPDLIYGSSDKEEKLFNDTKDRLYSFRIKDLNKDDTVFRLKFQEYISYFTNTNNHGKELHDLLSSCLRLYCLGMDSPFHEQSFLYFWNLVERITLITTGNTEKVLSRGSSLSGYKYSLFKESVNELRSIRNKLVHDGINNVNGLNLGLLKVICHRCIIRLFNYKDLLKNKRDLEIFYQLSSLNLIKSDFDTIKDLIDFFPRK